MRQPASRCDCCARREGFCGRRTAAEITFQRRTQLFPHTRAGVRAAAGGCIIGRRRAPAAAPAPAASARCTTPFGLPIASQPRAAASARALRRVRTGARAAGPPGPHAPCTSSQTTAPRPSGLLKNVWPPFSPPFAATVAPHPAAPFVCRDRAVAGSFFFPFSDAFVIVRHVLPALTDVVHPSQSIPTRHSVLCCQSKHPPCSCPSTEHHPPTCET